MGYVKIKEETEDTLYLCREPSPKAWAILVGCTSLGLGAAYYCNDYLIWKLLYIAGAVFVGVSCFENWEILVTSESLTKSTATVHVNAPECVFDKKEKQVRLKTQNLFQKIIPSMSTDIVSADLNDLVNVSVSDEDIKYAGKGYIVVLHFASGIKLGVTESATFGDKSDHEAIVQKIYSFNELEKKAEEERKLVEDLIDLDDQAADSSDTDGEIKEDIKENIISAEVPVIGSTNIEKESEKNVPEVETVSSNISQSPITTQVDEAENITQDILPQEPSSISAKPDADTGSSSDESFEKIDKSAVDDFVDDNK